jgi:ABC-2 type transport system permease protein
MSARTPGAPTAAAALPALRGVLRAERLRAGTPGLWILPVSGLVLGTCEGAMWWFADAPRDWGAIYQWQGLVATGLWAPLAALAGGLVGDRDRRARSGGTLWRPVSLRAAEGAALLTAGLVALLFCAASVLPQALIGRAAGLEGMPAGRLIRIVAVGAVAAWPAVVLGHLVGRRRPWLWGVGIAVVWQSLGAVQAEDARWRLLPWTWMTRAQLPVLGIHQNCVPLAPGDPLLRESPLAALGLGLAMTAVLLSAGCLAPPADAGRAWGRRRTRSGEGAGEDGARRTAAGLAQEGAVPDRDPAARPARLAGAGRACRFAAGRMPVTVPVLAVLALLATAWAAHAYGLDLAMSLTLLIVMPGGASVAAIALFAAVDPARTLVGLRVRRAGALVDAQMSTLLGAVLVVMAGSALAWSTAGAVPARGCATAVAAGVVVGMLAAAVAAFLQMRFSTATAVVGVLGLELFSLTVCGSPLGESTGLWVAAPLGWGITVLDQPARAAVLLPAAAALTGVLWRGAARATAASARPASRR